MPGLLPIPFEQYIPAGFKRDAKLIAYADEMDKILNEILTETKQLNNIFDPATTKAIALDLLGGFLNGGIKNNDSETLKRQKVSTAVATHKVRGTFKADVKIKIDNIAGGDSVIFRASDQDDFIFVGDGLTPSAFYWAAMGADGIDDGLGPSFIGSGLEIEQAGNVFIDVDNSSLTVDEQESIRLDILDSVPSYYYVHIGYVNVGGQFIEYFVMGV
jgi:hypothetical protein